MNQFKQICLIVMFTSRGGIQESSPDYIEEKTSCAENQTDNETFAMLDAENMMAVISYHDRWGLPVEQALRDEAIRQYQAGYALGLF